MKCRRRPQRRHEATARRTTVNNLPTLRVEIRTGKCDSFHKLHNYGDEGVNISNGVRQRHPRGAIILQILQTTPYKPIWLLRALRRQKASLPAKNIFWNSKLESSFLNLIKAKLWQRSRRRGFVKFNLGNLVLSQV